MDTKTILIAAAFVGLTIGVVGVQPSPTLIDQDDELSDLIEPDPVLQARFDASLRELRQLEQAERDQIKGVVDPAEQALIASGQPLTVREVAMLNGTLRPPTAEFSSRIAPSRYEQSVNATDLGTTLSQMPSYDLSSASRDFLARESRTRSALRDMRAPNDTEMFSNTPLPNNGAIGTQTGQYYAPAGPNGYVSSRDGTYFSRTGPNGVINTRTGAYTPSVP